MSYSLRFCFVALVLGRLASAQANFTIDTVAGSSWVGDGANAIGAILRQAEGLTADANGNVYIADAQDHRIRVLSSTGIIRTIAGNGIAGFSGDGGQAKDAQLNSPYGVLLDPRGNLFIADLGNSRVRRISPDGRITTVAGGGNLPAGGPNEGTLATLLALDAPRNLAMDSLGNLYISDFHAQRVYRLDTSGVLTTAVGTGVAGFGGDGGPAAASRIAYPTAVAVDRDDNLYVSDSQNHLVRRVSHGLIASYARALTPTGLALDGKSTLYIADPAGGQIIEIPQAGKATAISISAHDLAFAADGSLYASDASVVRRITPAGAVTTAAGGGDPARGDGSDPKQSLLNHPAGIAVDTAGTLYIADRDNGRIRKVANGMITTLASELNGPQAVGVDLAGSVYVPDPDHHRVQKIGADGRLTIVPSTGLISPVYVVPGSAGELYVADTGLGAILRVDSRGVTTTLKDGLKGPRGLALDRQGGIYFTEMDGQRVSKLALDGSLTQLANGFWNIPRAVVVSASGTLYVADTGLQQIVQIDLSGRAKVVAGTGVAGFSGDGGLASAAQLGFPWDIAAGPNGELYFADLTNNRIRSLIPGPDEVVTNVAVLEVVNAASHLPGPLAAGMLVEVHGLNVSASDVPNVQVLFGAQAGTVLSTSDSGLIVVTPSTLEAGIMNVEVRHQGVSAGMIRSVVIADSAPALFADATGQAAANNEDGTLNSSANPDGRGSIVSLFGTGFGVSNGSVRVKIGDYDSDVLYAGPANGYPGLFQINARAPGGFLAPGAASVVVMSGASATQGGVRIYVQ
jgi:uncharacterized protein (TIGR03437 family)